MTPATATQTPASHAANTTANPHATLTSATGAPGTHAQGLHRVNPAVEGAIRTLVEQARAASAHLTGTRPPKPELKESYDAFMARAAEVRGRPLLYPFVASGLGNGPLVELADGSVKWDMICGIGVHFFGHSHPALIEAALRGSLDDTLKNGNLMSGFEPYTLAETILREARRSSRLRHAYIATGGAMANENALKVCYQKRVLDNMRSLAADPNLKPETLLARATPTMRVLAFKDCFMGRSLTMAQVGDNHQGREGLPNGVHVDYMPFWDPAAAERMGPGAQGKKRFIDMALWHLEQYVHRYPGGHACFIFELVQGEGGFNPGDRDYFKVLMDFCRASQIAIWDDEIQTFGRSPRSMFMYEHFDLGEYVDVFCVGKLTQACITMWTPEFNPRSGILSGTFTGEGPSFRVGQQIVEMMRDGDMYGTGGRIERHHALFRAHAAELIAKHPGWFPPVESLGGGGPDRLTGGLGAMLRLTPFGGHRDAIMRACKTCFDEGVILFYAGHGPYHLRMLPPMGVMSEAHWPQVFQSLERGLARAAS